MRAVLRQSTTTGRLSMWGYGRLAFADPQGQLTAWLLQALAAGADRLAAAGPLPATVAPRPVAA